MYALPDQIRSRTLSDVNGLEMHMLEAGQPDQPCVLLLHGFPDLAYGWRHVLPRLAQAGYYAIAPDQRGYGRTTGWQANYTDDIRPFGMQNLATDITALLAKLKIKSVHCLVGHDFGAPVAAYTTLFRPDLFHRLILMSAPFPGAPSTDAKAMDLDAGLRDLPEPRRHYQSYNAGPEAEPDMLGCDQGLFDFLRGYFHMKSADWPLNQPFPLAAWRAEELAKMPHYYVMPEAKSMPEVVADQMPLGPASWLSDDELTVFASEFARTGFQGALNWYRCSSDTRLRRELGIFYGKTIDIPCWYLAGANDWGTHQTPWALDRMKSKVCSNFQGDIHIANAGHWVQQEQAEQTADHIIDACKRP